MTEFSALDIYQKKTEGLKDTQESPQRLRERMSEINFCNHCQKMLSWQEFISEEHQRSYIEFWGME